MAQQLNTYTLFKNFLRLSDHLKLTLRPRTSSFYFLNHDKSIQHTSQFSIFPSTQRGPIQINRPCKIRFLSVNLKSCCRTFCWRSRGRRWLATPGPTSTRGSTTAAETGTQSCSKQLPKVRVRVANVLRVITGVTPECLSVSILLVSLAQCSWRNDEGINKVEPGY